ncbi:hypothetical protein Ddye_012421 [Dipteronia dyeriana]|uniref:SWIM-type domain-containing protein n=1 Tax=Dipteronia dyeriana TaxID=168575 RepID=A0AAD9X4F5_9ROSI|nr:hypothetical protein Ddye_012421 [Dipteronia dyeriana]
MTSRWTIPRSELYSIQPIRSKVLFEDKGDQGPMTPIYKGQLFMDKQTLKEVVSSYVLEERFKYKVRRSNHTRFAITCRKNGCEWVVTAGKLKNETYWHVKSFVKEHTCGDSGNCNIDFRRVSSYVIEELYVRKFSDPGCNLRPKDIMSEFRDERSIKLSYNKAYRSKTCVLHKTFGDLVLDMVLKQLRTVIHHPERVMFVSDQYADEHIKQRVLPSQRSEIHPIDFHRFKVDNKWNEAIIDLEQCSCSYHEWDLYELPCIHAMAVARFKGIPIKALCSDFFTTEWSTCLGIPVNLIPKPETWDISDTVCDRIVLPWVKRKLPGRPKQSRTPSAWEKGKRQTCSNCGERDTIKKMSEIVIQPQHKQTTNQSMHL